MQINFNNTINKPNYIYSSNKKTMLNRNFIDSNFQRTEISFQAGYPVKPVISTKIEAEKSKILRKTKEILKTNIPILNEEQLWEIIERRAIAILKMKKRKRFSFELELDTIYNSPYLSPQQKFNRICEIEKEEKELDKIDPFAIPEHLIPKETKENYDYKLIEKFHKAISDNDFNLQKIYQEHYAELNEIETVSELKNKFPSLIVPENFENVIADKIIKTLPRNAYEELNAAVKSDDDNLINSFIINHFIEKTILTLNEIGIEDEAYISNFLEIISEKFAKICSKTIRENRLGTIPQVVKSYIPDFSDIDKKMSQINYDKFVLYVLKEHYINGKKLNDITYTEGDISIKVADLKGTEYKFEKFSENIKRFITSADKIKEYQRDYLKFTAQELKDRLMYYEQTELGQDEELFNLFVEFESCKFTEEDRNYLIKFLQILDDISDKKKTLEEGKDFLQKGNIKPHGTNKINELIKAATAKKIKMKQQENIYLMKLRDEFNNMINMLYEKGLFSIADDYSQYYPSTTNPKEIEQAELIISFVVDCLNKYDKNTAQMKIKRWEIYNDFLKNDKKSPLFTDAMIYSKSQEKENYIDTIGQYLINRELVENYPESEKLFTEPSLLKNIVETIKNKDLATKLLCRYENFKNLPDDEKSSIFDILKYFNDNNSVDKIVFKHIVENHYLNCDTSIVIEKDRKPQRRTIAAKAKQELQNYYQFPRSLEFFKKFENALPLNARYEDSSGVKKTDKYDDKMDIKYELKIMGHTDRLFACNKDFYFDSFSETGFHK